MRTPRDDIIEGSNKVKAFFAPLVDEGQGLSGGISRAPFRGLQNGWSVARGTVDVSDAFSRPFCTPPTDEETHTLPIVSELRHRSSWMASSGAVCHDGCTTKLLTA